MMKDRVAETPLRYVALMRGINVGGKNMLPMKDLVGFFEAAGCGQVATYIQSGNVVFCADDKVVKRLETVIAMKVEERFGLKVPVVLRTASEMKAVVRGNPFLKAGAAEEMLHVSFLADCPGKNLVAGLDAMRSPPDEFAVIGREIYMKLVNGAARTKLTNAYFDSKLQTVSTMRNWRTVLKLAEMMA
ncbi:DUF1697 domain-containing protein [Tunturiibacter gelidoferens]|uniref:Uncharacterized protein (DUF1697 family) n=1 Tax=Tunturiibacter lichenicola TaxID=2051959 RepID=A0A7Y9NL73_9BACT|nr:DUF1697 domain-containing protein [Edaphobacter lichenicola]NYF51415.1 uncharacterized protein (DUF1697 family) [Edaphobacter lichenicola]